MSIVFQRCPNPTVGVEIEIQLIDPITKNLTPAARPLLQDAAAVKPLNLKAELTEAMVEINTEICRTVREAGESIRQQLDLLRALADKRGVEIAVSGTHPFQSWRERKIFPHERYFQILEKYQWLARRWTVFAMHVHVGLADGDRAIRVINALIGYIPHLLALSSSSPFWGGTDTGLASSRAAVLESFPTGGLPFFFPDWQEFEKYYETLTATGAIGSIKDIYWDIRPHFDFGTVEVRVCDGLPTIRESLALIALIQCLVVWIDDQFQKGSRLAQVNMKRYWLAPENKWQAIRYGLEGQIVTPDGERRSLRGEIEKLLETLRPVAVSLECQDELELVKEILSKGPSAARQRSVFARTQSHRAIVEALIKEFKEDTFVH